MSRVRALLRSSGRAGVALVVAVTGLAGASLLAPQLAGAANGASVKLGQTNTATLPTTVKNSAGSGLEGDGVKGGFGLKGTASDGVGVFGRSTFGTGVVASTSEGTAFSAHGPVFFSSSGIATVKAGHSTQTVAPVNTPLIAASKILCTLMKDPGPGVVLKACVKNTTAGNFVIRLTGNATSNVTVAWFVIE